MPEKEEGFFGSPSSLHVMAATFRGRSQGHMSEEELEERGIFVKEYGERTLKAARLYSLLRQECEIEEPWHIMALTVCAFEQVHIKEGWEFVLANKQDIEDVGQLFERSNSPQEFRDGLIELKERDLMEQLERSEPDL
jgi:hypothetical protein